jgi:hypothetical protein
LIHGLCAAADFYRYVRGEIMKFKALTTLVLVTTLFGCVSIASSLPEGAIQKGTLANGKLIQDAKLGLVQKVAILGCSKVETFEPYVLAMPQGNVGSRYWHELWIAKGCSSEYQVKLRFSEDGPYAANYTIE